MCLLYRYLSNISILNVLILEYCFLSHTYFPDSNCNVHIKQNILCWNIILIATEKTNSLVSRSSVLLLYSPTHEFCGRVATPLDQIYTEHEQWSTNLSRLILNEILWIQSNFRTGHVYLTSSKFTQVKVLHQYRRRIWPITGAQRFPPSEKQDCLCYLKPIVSGSTRTTVISWGWESLRGSTAQPGWECHSKHASFQVIHMLPFRWASSQRVHIQ